MGLVPNCAWTPPQGAMLAVQAPLAKIEELMDEFKRNVVLANRNSPTQGVLSGPTAAIAEMSALVDGDDNATCVPGSAGENDSLKAAARS